MKKTIFLFFVFAFALENTFAQKLPQARIDSLESLLLGEANDTGKVKLLIDLSNSYHTINTEKGIQAGNMALSLSEKLHWDKGMAEAYRAIGMNYYSRSEYPQASEYNYKGFNVDKKLGNKKGMALSFANIGSIYFDQKDFPSALDYFSRALDLYKTINDKSGTAASLASMGMVYHEENNYPKALDCFYKVIDVLKQLKDEQGVARNLGNIGSLYFEQGKYTEALVYDIKSYRVYESLGDKIGTSLILENIGNAYGGQGLYVKALESYFKSLEINKALEYQTYMATNLADIGKVYFMIAKDSIKQILPDSLRNKSVNLGKAISYLNRACFLDQVMGDKDDLQSNYKLISEIQQFAGNYKEALEAYKKYSLLKDSTSVGVNKKKFEGLISQREASIKQKELEIQKLQLESVKKERTYYLTGLALLLLLLALLYNRFWLKKRSNDLLEKAYTDLQGAELQLIQSEKLASLGQLTAGVAHEINNPINFVSTSIPSLKRNFEDIKQFLSEYEKLELSEEQRRRIDEIKNTLDIDYTISESDTLLGGISEGANRTAEIVRGLKNFSRSDEVEMHSADINEGIESTLLLLSKKIMEKNISIEKQFGSLPQLMCFPGQLNQLWMNLLSNAIDSLDNQGKIVIRSELSATKKELIVSIKDNGYGMSEEVRKKIFDPFFTTKDVGKGTGLGLSISHGIVEKHKGKIEVKSEVGKGSEFIVALPVS